MKKLILLLNALIIGLSNIYAANAQISGVVRDQDSGEVLPFASVLLLSTNDSSLLAGTMTNSNGFFEIQNISFGAYQMEVSYMGFEKRILPIELNQPKLFIEVALSKKSFQLNDIEVTAEQELLEESVEKTTINIEKNESISGGNALDIMQTLPSVDVDVNGEIRYRGSNRVTLLIDGKPSELVKHLEQIPAHQIQKIEIINNPSAKYEADGMSGIINIQMKKASKGMKGTRLNVFAGLPETLGGSFGFYENTPQTNYYANASINRKTQFQTKEHWRSNFEDVNAADYYQYDRQDQILNNLMINAGVRHQITEKQEIQVAFVAGSKMNSALRSINYQTWDKEQNTLFNANKDIDIFLRNMLVDGTLGYLYQLNKTQKLQANLNFNYLKQSQEMNFDFYPVASPELENSVFQNTYSDQLNSGLDFSLDYSWNISDSALLETGYRYTREDLFNDFKSETYDFEEAIWNPDTALANEFNFLQQVHALYFNYEKSFRFVQLQLGFRGEYTRANQFIKAKEDYFDWFPSVMLSKKLDKHFGVFASYNRRINRPILKMINPYTNEYADILNMHIGNPDLKPEYVNSLEIGSRFSSDHSSAKISAYYRHIDQAISRVKYATNDSALWVTFMNLDQAKLFGGELSLSVDAAKWWQINANANVFHTTLLGIYGLNQIDKSHTGWTATMSHQFKLPWKLQMQWYFYYKSELPDVLGTYMERYFADVALSKKVLKNKGKVIFKISDVFDTYRYGLDLVGLDDNGNHYSQKNRRKNESQYFILSFVYNFKAKEKKKKENFFLEGFGK
jgi:outer membrane receptor for ferrienterochelin and colicin